MSYRKHLMPSDISPSVAYEATAVDSDTISRQAAIDALDEIEAEVADGYGYQYAKWREYFAKMPPARPERIRGRWINGHCDKCNEHAPFWAMASTYYESNFCPNCGADMKGEQDG